MNTLFLLIAKFETADIPLEIVAKKYFSHNKDEVSKWARHRKYPLPVFRGGSQKSQWLVSAPHLADFLDEKKRNAEKEFKLSKGDG